MFAFIKRIIYRLGYKIKNFIDEKKFLKIYNRFKEFTMIPSSIYIENLFLINNFLKDLDGEIVECGVWRGGMTGGIATILGKNRKYHLFDSFEGLPQAKPID